MTMLVPGTIHLKVREKEFTMSQSMQDREIHYENTPIQIYRKYHLQKNENFQIKN